MMRSKLMLWGAAAAIALSSTATVASVVVVKSLGPSSKAYPPGKTLPESAKITLQGGDIVTVLGPASAQTLRGPGNFDAKQVTLASAAAKRGRFGALRAAEVAHNPSIWDVDVSQSGKICVAEPATMQLWRPESDTAVTVQIRAADGASHELTWAAGKALDRMAGFAADHQRRAISGRMARHGREKQPRFRDGQFVRRPTWSARLRC